jgi:ABC-type Fe3+-siderophore transport system permease subunit
MKASAVDQQGSTRAVESLEHPGAKREFWLLLFGLTLVYIFVLTIANRRYVWYDEIFTFDIARSPSLQQLWNRELKFDNHTPTGYLLSRLSMSVFGPTPFGLRFPSMVEFYVGSIAILLYVRRKAGIAFAAVAVLMLWAGAPTLFYAVEARPYALTFASFACLLLSWDTAIRTRPRRLALFGIAISTLLMSAAHLFAPFTLFAFVAAEAVRFWRRREPDYALWAALFLPMLVMLIYIPLIRASEGVVFSGQASFGSMGKFFEETLSAPVMFFVVLAALLVPQPRKDDAVRPEFLPEEFMLLACLFLSPILMNLFLIHRQKAFVDRYGIASQAGILAAFAIFLAYRFRLSRAAAWAASIVLLFFLLRNQVWHALRNPFAPNAPILASVQPNLPIVVGEGMVFMEMNHHEQPAIASRLYFLKDVEASMRYVHSSFYQTFEAPDDMKAAGFPIPGKVEQYSTFVRQHHQFLLIGAPVQWVFIKLRLDGASIAYLDDFKDARPYTDTVLYLVTMPSNTGPAVSTK